VTAGVPILMYHAFSRTEAASRFVLPARRFRRQLAVLRLLRYRPLSLTAYAELRRSDGALPGRSFVVTIDDAYVDVRTVAAPVLHRRGVPATLFVPSGYVGRVNDWDARGRGLLGRPVLTWHELDALPDEFEIGAHTRTHPRLPELDAEQAIREIDGSRTDIARELKRVPASFSYPFGATSVALEAAVAQLGFSCACGVRDGLNSGETSLYALRRIEIYGTDSLLRFMLKLRTGRRDPRLVELLPRLPRRRPTTRP
jgi:peptidoglycan/xylan/chitin deacetylase (PgdA/CDA1 family)